MLLLVKNVIVVDCVGFIEVLVIGMLIRWISVNVRLIVIGVNLVGVWLCVDFMIMIRNIVVSIILYRKVVVMLYLLGDSVLYLLLVNVLVWLLLMVKLGVFEVICSRMMFVSRLLSIWVMM